MRFSAALLKNAETLLSELLFAEAPADSVVSQYFRLNPRLGHAERGVIAETVYAVLRFKRSLMARCGEKARPRALILAAWLMGKNSREVEPLVSAREHDWLMSLKAIRLDSLPPAVRLDLPDWLYTAWLQHYGSEEEVAHLATSLLKPAPLDLRVNLLKANREEIQTELAQSGLVNSACALSPWGIRLQDKPALARHPLFLNGRIEVQDEGSQLLALLLAPKRGEMVADFCAGAGGKTLALGAMMRSQGRLYAFDVSEKRLSRLKPRLARSGLSNVYPVRIASEHDTKVKRLQGKLDRVLVDAPCSGLGTLRRNPDLKWRQTPESVAELTVKQAAILEAAALLLKPGGRLVYATCSLLPSENEDQVQHFLSRHTDYRLCSAPEILKAQGVNLSETGEFLRLFPHRHGTDGFFAAVFERV